MKKRKLAMWALVTCCLLLVGCFSSATVAALSGPAQHAKSPNLDARETWRIAVLPPVQTASSEVSTDALYDYAGMLLMRTGRFTLVDRARVDALLQEQQFSYSGLVDPATAVRLGRMLGAEAVLVVNITSVKHDPFWDDSPEQRNAELHVKIIAVETGEVLYSATGQGSDFEGADGA